jgi:hypothetical protein
MENRTGGLLGWVGCPGTNWPLMYDDAHGADGKTPCSAGLREAFGMHVSCHLGKAGIGHLNRGVGGLSHQVWMLLHRDVFAIRIEE